MKISDFPDEIKIFHKENHEENHKENH